MNQIKLFISSRVNSPFQNKISDYKLSDLRKRIKRELEKEILLKDLALKVIINEDSFNENLNKTWYEQCLLEMQDCHMIIILYSGHSGWSEPNSDTNGICHDEYLLAMREFALLTYMIDISQYFDYKDLNDFEQEKNNRFQEDIKRDGIFKETINASNAEELEDKILTQIRKKIGNKVIDSIENYKSVSKSANLFGGALDWSKMNYNERVDEMVNDLKKSFNKNLHLKEIIKEYHAIPDTMGIADARNRIERPYLQEHILISNHPKMKKGIVHFIGVYGNVTPLQAKNLVGYPDITVITTPFGIYMWDKVRHIQIFFLKKCMDAQTIPSRLREVNLWLVASRELTNVITRAAARYEIVSKIKEMQIHS